MRFNGLVLTAAFAALSACGGGEQAGTDTGAAQGGGAAPSAAPVTGTVHEVRMLGDERGYYYDPENLTIKQGDGVRWIMISGAPHNVAFQDVPAAGRAQLAANMPNQLTDLSSPMLLNPNETYEMSFAGVAPGRYDYVCTPHIANNMRGSITVQ